MRTNTFTTTRQTGQQDHQGARYPRSTLTLLSVSVLTFGLISSLLAIPATAKSGRGSSGSSSSHHRGDDTLSGRLSHDDDRNDDEDGDRNRQDRQDERDDNNRNRHGIHDDDNEGNDDNDRNRNNNMRGDDRNRDDNKRRDNDHNVTNNKKHIDGQVTHVDNMRFTVRTSDGKTRAFKHASFDYTNDSDRPQENDRVRVDFKDSSGRQPFRVTRIN